MKKIFTILSFTAVATICNAQIVINEVYGGGGNSGTIYKNDFIELINNGTSVVTLPNATIQYASSAGLFYTYQSLPSITLNPGQTYLIQEGVGTGGTTNLPSPDFIGTTLVNFDGSNNNATTGFAMSATKGKVALVSDNVQITAPGNSNVLDFVGFGTANQWEGTGPTAAPTNTDSISRTNGIDTNDNAADFTVGAPTPQGTLAVSDVSAIKVNLVKNSNVNNTIVFGAKANVQIIAANGQVVKTASVLENTKLDVSSLPKGMYIISADVNGQKVSQKIMKN